LEGLLEAEGLAPLFGSIADSGAVGTIKPAAGIFLHALERLGARPAQALMVGDSLTRDIRGAEALGMAHAWLVPDRSPLAPCRGLGPAPTPGYGAPGLDPDSQGPCCPAGRTIRSLTELSNLAAEPAGAR
jgi:FMN phosphatase YigB (HAD superfamily)